MPTPKTRTVLHQILDDASELAESTRNRYRHDVDEWIEFAGSHPSDWTSIRMESYYRHLIKNEELQVNTANVKLASLRYVSKWFVKHYNGHSFVDIRTSVWNTKADRRVLTQEQIIMLLERCSPPNLTPIDIRDRTIIIVALETGMRRISLVGLDFDKIDTSNGYPVATVPIKGRGHNKMFEVPLSNTAMKALGNWQGWLGRKHGRVFCSLTKHTTRDGVRYAAGKAISTTAINKIVTKRAKDAGIDHIHPHLFRNTYVTSRFQGGSMPHHIAAITGHEISGLGAMGGYIDMRSLAEEARNSTPAWLVDLVDRIIG